MREWERFITSYFDNVSDYIVCRYVAYHVVIVHDRAYDCAFVKGAELTVSEQRRSSNYNRANDVADVEMWPCGNRLM